MLDTHTSSHVAMGVVPYNRSLARNASKITDDNNQDNWPRNHGDSNTTNCY